MDFMIHATSAVMPKRQRVKQTATLQDRISEWADGVRKEAHGPQRDELLKKVRRAVTAMHLGDWANSAGLQSPE
jgi:hypothetical protein